MDTAKDKKRLDDLHEGGKAPWEVWKSGHAVPASVAPSWVRSIGNHERALAPAGR
jgi:hypothetical protein